MLDLQVVIHPFKDGNGRTARFLMNLILMQNGFPPLIFTPKDRNLYNEKVSVSCEENHPEQFINFVAKLVPAALSLPFWWVLIKKISHFSWKVVNSYNLNTGRPKSRQKNCVQLSDGHVGVGQFECKTHGSGLWTICTILVKWLSSGLKSGPWCLVFQLAKQALMSGIQI